MITELLMRLTEDKDGAVLKMERKEVARVCFFFVFALAEVSAWQKLKFTLTSEVAMTA